MTWAPDAQRNLAELYRQNPAIRGEIAIRTNELESVLGQTPLTIGVSEIEDIRRVVRPPIAILYKVREADRVIKVLWVKLWDE
ncbi:MAG: hypothetical protein IAF94_25300 [Pirellulaceae bacterium]|nr:hypothetical protein [Pirellulaceae bacterium]